MPGSAATTSFAACSREPVRPSYCWRALWKAVARRDDMSSPVIGRRPRRSESTRRRPLAVRRTRPARPSTSARLRRRAMSCTGRSPSIAAPRATRCNVISSCGLSGAFRLLVNRASEADAVIVRGRVETGNANKSRQRCSLPPAAQPLCKQIFLPKSTGGAATCCRPARSLTAVPPATRTGLSLSGCPGPLVSPRDERAVPCVDNSCPPATALPSRNHRIDRPLASHETRMRL